MGKGLLADSHPLCISAARSSALAEADVVLIIGARLNWILHYGKAPKWREDVKLIRLDISPESIDDNKVAEVALVGDAQAILTQICEELRLHSTGNAPQGLPNGMPPGQTAWYKSLLSKCHDNAQKLIQKTMIFPSPSKAPGSGPSLLTYHQAFHVIKKVIPRNHVFIGEGANTMDIARSMFDVQEPRSRLDAGTQATMGVGLGYCIAAARFEQTKAAGRRPVIAVVGDSAFGFSAMEIETAARNRLGMLIIVMNNGGVRRDCDLSSADEETLNEIPLAPGLQRSPSGCLQEHSCGKVATDSLVARSEIRPTRHCAWWQGPLCSNAAGARNRRLKWYISRDRWHSNSHQRHYG